jgi:hypothetical protein
MDPKPLIPFFYLTVRCPRREKELDRGGYGEVGKVGVNSDKEVKCK